MEKKKPSEKDTTSALAATETALYAQIQDVLQQARQRAKRSVNQTMVQAYWQIGQLIVQHEQGGQERAVYGTRLLTNLAERLTADFGKGFAVQSLRNYRQFYLTLPNAEIRYLRGRIAFKGTNSKGVYSDKNKGRADSMIVIFHGWL